MAKVTNLNSRTFAHVYIDAPSASNELSLSASALDFDAGAFKRLRFLLASPPFPGRFLPVNLLFLNQVISACKHTASNLSSLIS